MNNSQVNKLRQCRHWIFDMDGTLTHAIHDFDAIRKQLGLPAGKPILESIAHLAPDKANLITQRLNSLEMEIAAQSTLQPGAVELLGALSKSGCKLGILTRNGKAIAHKTLSAVALEHYFPEHTIVSRDCCTPKPDPAGIHLLLSRWHADASTAVMVGDYLFDLQAGASAGLATVHLAADGNYQWPDLTSVGVRSLAELQQLIYHEST